MIITAIGSPLA
jgi:hypothetical protein